MSINCNLNFPSFFLSVHDCTLHRHHHQNNFTADIFVLMNYHACHTLVLKIHLQSQYNWCTRWHPIFFDGLLPKKKNRTDTKAKVVAAGWKTELFLLNAALEIQRLDDLKKRINRRKILGRMGDLEKMYECFCWMVTE